MLSLVLSMGAKGSLVDGPVSMLRSIPSDISSATGERASFKGGSLPEEAGSTSPLGSSLFCRVMVVEGGRGEGLDERVESSVCGVLVLERGTSTAPSEEGGGIIVGVVFTSVGVTWLAPGRNCCWKDWS